MEAGKLRTKITLQVASTRRDGTGEELPSSTFAVCWADIQPLTNKYTERSQHTLVESTHVIVIRYIDGVTSAMTVQEGSLTYNIEAAIDPDRKKRKLNLMSYLRNDGFTS